MGYMMWNSKRINKEVKLKKKRSMVHYAWLLGLLSEEDMFTIFSYMVFILSFQYHGLNSRPSAYYVSVLPMIYF